MAANKVRYTIGDSIVFDVDSRYKITGALGKGAFGTVVKGVDTSSGEEVAIKKINPFVHVVDAKRTLRELKILAQLDHPNIISLKDIMSIPHGITDTFQDLYVVTDLMETDLHQIIQSDQPLEEAHLKYFMYQLFKGLKYLHSANTLHRDLKPSNLLVNADSQLKICDFGLSRVDEAAVADELDALAPGDAPADMNVAGASDSAVYTEYVVTRWYRAPEVICDRRAYGKPVDIWSAGCILAEMLGRTVLLPGRDQVQQLALTLELVGTPADDVIDSILNKNARRYVKSYRKVERKPFGELFPRASAEAIDLLETLLQWNPLDRPTAEEALEHPFLQDYRNEADEKKSKDKFLQFDFEQTKLSIPTIRRLVYNEMLFFHPELGEHIPSTSERVLALTDDELATMDDSA
ncbi:CMGC/MAPK protein kinase [Thecamonas trahens ATCC 50062]|uniref:CMGC/MAPK protein kinase n=1 Tax=Thecamonas trahens ATCC 50062 TaxID=461836 RepID=A0A0L0DGY8_THETB|nr:CMGC/MAPK protein kinase [Thecamonas trahens ATCC 50062]KNC51577.1 CMGC/MAPK protein kinase [Thecamonas trahens ATCC 50062]|eukprot:XP_013755979.1 CMGC/MAPK protein kinase [Thecamonas trahens ATCC 50062]